MKLRRFSLIVSLVAIAASHASAVDLYWNAGGDGVWSTGPADKNWNTVPGAVSGNITWADPSMDVAVFDSAFPTTITVFDAVSTSGISLIGASHSIEAGTITLVPDALASAPFVAAQSGILTIRATLDGTDGLFKTGSAALVLENAHIYTGLTSVSSGTLDLVGSLVSSDISISSGATLVDANGGLSASALLTNAGTFTVNASDTISNYIQNGSGLLNGSSTLTATSITLNGGTVAGSLLGNTTSTGNVLVSGSLGGGSLDITGGTLNLTGVSGNTPITISAGAALVDGNGGLSASAALTNAGTLTVNAADIISSYIQNGSGLIDGSSTLTATSITLNGGTVAGSLLGNTTSTGNVLVSGSLGAGSLDITSGTLNLTGVSGNTPIAISAGAALIDANGGLSASALLTNAGTFTVNSADTISNYIQNGSGLLNGSSTLTATSITLNGGTVAGSLLGNTTSTGNVALSGSLGGFEVNIAGGVFTNTGSLTATSRLNIATGATLSAGGTQEFGLLTTSGPGVATWQGNLSNNRVIAPGGAGGIGHLVITGNFSNGTVGSNRFDLGGGANDFVSVGGSATFGGVLDLNQTGAITPFVPVQIVAAGSYSGNYASLTENLDAIVWFNPHNGTVTPIALPPSLADGTLYGTTANQTSSWIALYDDVIDPGVENITRNASGAYSITSGIASLHSPVLLNALAASITPGGLDAALLNRLSPESYAGFGDYAMHATRSHQRAALQAPTLGHVTDGARPCGQSSKHALEERSSGPGIEWYAACDAFGLGADSSVNSADYDMSGCGLIGGLRAAPSDFIRAGVYVAANNGDVQGGLIDGEASGWSLGMYAKMLIEPRYHAILTAGVSYGSYDFDGSRAGASVTGAGWVPESLGFENVSADALDFHIAVSPILWKNDRFLLMPSVGLRYVSGSMDGFTEDAGSAAGAVALQVDDEHYQAVLAELSLKGEIKVSSRVTMNGFAGATMGFGDDGRAIRARFVDGARTMSADAPGVGEDAVFLGGGVSWRPADDLIFGLDWRSDFRNDSEVENRVGISTVLSF